MSALSGEQMQQLLDRANHEIPYEKYRQWLIIKTLAKTGLRVGELVKLKPRDLDPTFNQIFVPAGKGKKRDVEVDPELIRELQLYARNLSIRKDRPIFPISRQAVGSMTKKRTGINPHAFRHSYAKALHDKTGNVEYVRKQLGHSDLKITQIYLDGMSGKKEKDALRDLYR